MIGSALFLDDYFGESTQVSSPEDLKKVKSLVIWGGEDISPSIYNQRPAHTKAPETPSLRDRLEMELVNEAVRRGLPILGICRGAQLLCAMHGGSLWQHVDKHTRGHFVKLLKTGYVGYSNSAHHQMMRPDKDAKILGVTHPRRTIRRFDEGTEPIYSDEPEPEIVFFPKLRALGVQGHPEWLSKDSWLTLVTKMFFSNLQNNTLGE